LEPKLIMKFMVRLFRAETGDGNMCERRAKRQKEL